ncbi:MAG: hypothetical protein LBN11_02900 [Tannerella sp.]|jgi:hypothetical protein|nr:hypothetical protein [Tannerella sp.]
MEIKTLENDKRNKLRFATFIIPKFADAYKMDRQEAYRYLKNMVGLIFFSTIGGLYTPIILFGQ